MKSKIIFRIASCGLFMTVFFFLNYSSLFSASNFNYYVILFLSILLWIIPTFLQPVKNLKRAILFIDILITFLVLFSIFNLILILKNPSNIKPYGWIFIAACFIACYLMIRKANLKKYKKSDKYRQDPKI